MCTDAKRRLSLPASLDMEEADGEVAVGTWQASARARRSWSSKALGFFNPIFGLSACHRLGWRAGRSIDSDTHINLHPLAL